MRQTNDEGVMSAESRGRTRQQRFDVERTSERRRRNDVKDDGRNRRQARSASSGQRRVRVFKTMKTTTGMRCQDGDRSKMSAGVWRQDDEDDRNATSGRRQKQDDKTLAGAWRQDDEDDDRNAMSGRLQVTSRRRRRWQEQDFRTSASEWRQDNRDDGRNKTSRRRKSGSDFFRTKS